MTNALLKDIQLKTEFADGDRVIVRTSSNMTEDQVKRIERSLKKSTKAELRVLVVNCLQLHIVLFRPGQQPQPISAPRHAEMIPSAPGTANVNLAKIEFLPGDILGVVPKGLLNRPARELLRGGLARWAGDGVAIRILKGE